MPNTQVLPQHAEEPANNTQSISAAILFMLSLLLINEVVVSFLNKIKIKYPRLVFLQPTTMTTLIGLVAGFLLNLTDIINIRLVMKQGFSSFFLIVLLPPILYESAINMERELFFKNFGSIIVFAVFGTLFAALVTTAIVFGVAELLQIKHLDFTACLAFGALISATDPVAVLSIFKEVGVDPILFSLIFGESILNDAVSIILFDTTVKSKQEQTHIAMGILNFFTVFIGSIIIGMLIGMICAYVLKHRDKVRRKNSDNQNAIDAQNNRETTILFVVPYVSYLISEGLSMSGIVSIMFCGIAMARYALPNVNPSIENLNKRLYHTLAYSCENMVFIFIGIGFVSFDLAWKEAGFWLIFLSCIALHLARAANITFMSFILNKNRIKTKINKKYQFFLWFSGFRGAMAFALSLKSTEIFMVGRVGDIMLTITLVFAMTNIFINANLLHPLIIKYDIQQKSGPQAFEDEEDDEQSKKRFWARVKSSVTMCDDNCIKKILLRDQSVDQQEEEEQKDNNQDQRQDIEMSESYQKTMKQNLISQNNSDNQSHQFEHNQDIFHKEQKNKSDNKNQGIQDYDHSQEDQHKGNQNKFQLNSQKHEVHQDSHDYEPDQTSAQKMNDALKHNFHQHGQTSPHQNPHKIRSDKEILDKDNDEEEDENDNEHEEHKQH